MDKDEDDKLVEDEYVSFFAARFDSKDTDKNGYLDSSEFKSAKAFKVGDADKDGNLTREEYETIFVRQFRNLDKNKDGCLSPAEISRK